jgi:hypothetical protein
MIDNDRRWLTMIDDDKCYTSLAPVFQKDIVGRRLHSWLKGIKSMTHVILFWSLLDEFGDSQGDRLKVTRIELCCCVMLRLPCLLLPVYRGTRSDIIKRYQHLVQSTALSLVTGWYLYLYRYRMIYIYTVYISNITCTRIFIYCNFIMSESDHDIQTFFLIIYSP